MAPAGMLGHASIDISRRKVPPMSVGKHKHLARSALPAYSILVVSTKHELSAIAWS
jgi:hypothetical protein